jgi:hypothetical protein
MNRDLEIICKIFETTKGFMKNPTKKKCDMVEMLFESFMVSFSFLREEKLDYPQEFRDSVTAYNDENKITKDYFEDIEMKYLILSDFYDYARLTKKYIKGRV